MNPSLVKRTAGSWLFGWEEPYQISMRVDRVRQHSNGNISGEITVVSGSDPLSRTGHMHHSMMSNLLGPRMRADIVKSLSERLETVNWTDMLEFALETVINDMRYGEPMFALTDMELPEDTAWVYPPILRQGHPTIIFGYGGTLKSYLVAYWGIRLAQVGWSVVVLDWESTPEDWRIRVEMIANGMNIAVPEKLYYRRCLQPLAEDIDSIRSLVGEHGGQVTIIDSAAYASTDEPEKSASAMAFFRALRSLGTTSLVVAHQRQDDKSKRPFGSVFWENSARSTIQVRKAEVVGNTTQVGLYNQKVNYGRPFQAFAMTAEFHIQTEERYTPGDTVVFSQGLITTAPELAMEGSSNDKVISYLQEHGSSEGRDIELATGVKSLYTVLSRLVSKGLVSKHGTSYELTGESL